MIFVEHFLDQFLFVKLMHGLSSSKVFSLILLTKISYFPLRVEIILELLFYKFSSLGFSPILLLQIVNFLLPVRFLPFHNLNSLNLFILNFLVNFLLSLLDSYSSILLTLLQFLTNNFGLFSKFYFITIKNKGTVIFWSLQNHCSILLHFNGFIRVFYSN